MWWSCPVGSPPKRVQRNWLRLKALLKELALVQVRLWKEVPREGRTSVRRSGARTLSHGASMIIARPRSSWHRPNGTTTRGRAGWPRLGAGAVRSGISAAGTDERAVTKRRGCSRVLNPSVSTAGTGHNYPDPASVPKGWRAIVDEVLAHGARRVSPAGTACGSGNGREVPRMNIITRVPPESPDILVAVPKARRGIAQEFIPGVPGDERRSVR